MIRSATWFEYHPNITSFFAWIMATVMEIIGAFILSSSQYAVQGDNTGNILGFSYVILSLVIILIAEIWNLHQKKQSQLNLLFNLIPLGFFIILLLKTKGVER